MKINKLSLILIFTLLGCTLFAQSPCDFGGIHPFCTDENPQGISYASGTSGSAGSWSGLGTSAPGCLGSTPAPAWYYMRIAQPGNLLIYIEQYSGSTGRDVDFICWGPFQASDGTDFVAKLCNGTYSLGTSGGSTHRPTNGDHSTSTGGYPVGNIVDCSYAGDPTEWCYIPNAQTGDYYLLLLTNYSQQPATISFNKVNVSYATSTTDCSVLLQITDNQPVCEGNLLELIYGDGDQESGVSYTWLGPNGFVQQNGGPILDRFNADETMNGVYRLVRSVGSVRDTAYSDSVFIMPKPEVQFHPQPNSVICQGEVVPIVATVTNYEFAFYKWGNSPFTVMPSASDTLNAALVLDQDTCFYLRVSSQGNGEGCSRRDTLCIEVPQTSAGLQYDHICVGDSYHNYGFDLPAQMVAGDTLLERHIENSSGCDSLVNVLLSRTLPPVVELVSLVDEHCDQHNGELIVNVLDGTPPFEYDWTPSMAEATDSLLNISGGTYKLKVSDSLECFAQHQWEVQNIPAPTACFTMNPASLFYNLGEGILFQNCSTGQTLNEWDMGDTYTTTEYSPYYTYPNEGNYVATLRVSDEFGCSDQTEREVIVHEKMQFYIPSAFSPNGDGVNEVFAPSGMGVDPASYTMFIYDRNGEIQFKTTNPYDYWDGRSKNGKMCPSGVYVYLIRLKSWDGQDKEYTGPVTLIR